SCLLFNLFIESLNRILHTHPTLRGVNVLGVVLFSLWYADDAASLAEGPEELQRILDIIVAWCAAWGMQVSTGEGKTEAMVFQRGMSLLDATTSLPPLRCGTQQVSWVGQYRYLGYLTRHDLCESAAISKIRDSLLANFSPYFTRHSHLRGTALAMQLQVYSTCVLGAVNYLRSIITLNAKVIKELEGVVRTAARLMSHYPASTSRSLVWIVTRMLTPSGICAREKERLYQQLQLTSYTDAIAPRLFRALRDEPASPGSRRGPYANWASTTERHHAALQRSGVPIPAPTSYADIARACNV